VPSKRPEIDDDAEVIAALVVAVVQVVNRPRQPEDALRVIVLQQVTVGHGDDVGGAAEEEADAGLHRVEEAKAHQRR
jgi:hypothetical protein